jgi:hypothetical protein
MGMASGRLTFGHNGGNYRNAWADPERDLVFACLTNQLGPGERAGPQSALSDTILKVCR